MNREDERVRTSAPTLLKVFEGLAGAMCLIVAGVMQYAPIGVFAFIAHFMAEQGTKVVGPLAKVVLAVYVGLTLRILLVHFVLLKVFDYHSG